MGGDGEGRREASLNRLRIVTLLAERIKVRDTLRDSCPKAGLLLGSSSPFPGPPKSTFLFHFTPKHSWSFTKWTLMAVFEKCKPLGALRTCGLCKARSLQQRAEVGGPEGTAGDRRVTVKRAAPLGYSGPRR